MYIAIDIATVISVYPTHCSEYEWCFNLSVMTD